MDESKPEAEKPKEERRFDPELFKKGLRCDLDQYEMLLRCSERKDLAEWNEWRRANSGEDILLEGAHFLLYDNAAGKTVGYLGEANLTRAHLRRATLVHTDLRRASLSHADLRGASFQKARLEGTDLQGAHLEGTDFKLAMVDGVTSLWKCRTDRLTDFGGVGLASLRIDPGTKQRLEYNIRRKNWEEWYENHPFQKWPVRWFWSLSDYGVSTWRIILWFFGLASCFAGIYGYWAYSSPPGIVCDLMVEPHLPAWHYFSLLVLRPLYFSIVTMTTLGFGDMYAEAESIWGHILLTIQVILGYVLLGALVTRFAVLFTAGGPAGEFADAKDEGKE